MINHLAVGVRNHQTSQKFYEETLRSLDYVIHRFGDDYTNFSDGISADPFGDFAIYQGEVYPMHIAFEAKNNKQVDEFYESALNNGGFDNGAPGYRSNYHENYYDCFIIDPDGYRIEAVCHNGQAH
ncbi:lactoylglutathione lyase [Floricoccus tropicus]|uniref:Lactoylglutathione lyase n=1 Tax=Floricoccus tropicus TaxID=1859473 RepID=A0A1E8GKE3_9LACT|nr:lactoylglutathione lyase [Floricoccus tropicus]OFI48721.1 lactoylglutathione lyase [Floricoccus tropicus]